MAEKDIYNEMMKGKKLLCYQTQQTSHLSSGSD